MRSHRQRFDRWLSLTRGSDRLTVILVLSDVVKYLEERGFCWRESPGTSRRQIGAHVIPLARIANGTEGVVEIVFQPRRARFFSIQFAWMDEQCAVYDDETGQFVVRAGSAAPAMNASRCFGLLRDGKSMAFGPTAFRWLLNGGSCDRTIRREVGLALQRIEVIAALLAVLPPKEWMEAPRMSRVREDVVVLSEGFPIDISGV